MDKYYKAMYRIFNEYLKLIYLHKDCKDDFVDMLWHELAGVVTVATQDDNVSSGLEFDYLLEMRHHMTDIARMMHCQPEE